MHGRKNSVTITQHKTMMFVGMHSTRSNSPVSDLDSASSTSSYYSDASPTDYGPSLTPSTAKEIKESEAQMVEEINSAFLDTTITDENALFSI